MIVKSLVLFFVVCTLGIQGSDQGYTFDEQTNAWFKYHETPLVWSDAQMQCEVEDATLLIPLTSEILDTFIYFLGDKEQFGNLLHTGVHANFSDSSFNSIEGVNVLSNLPIPLEKQDCVAWVLDKYRLRRIECTEKLPFVCFKNVSVPDCGHLDYQYSGISENCYKFHRQGATWDQANATCQEEGAQLAVANTVSKFLVLLRFYEKIPNELIVGDRKRDVAFVGVRKMLDSNAWMTVDGKTLEYTYFKWAENEPNNIRGDEYCGSVNRNGKLFDDSCQLILPYICEKSATMVLKKPIPHVYKDPYAVPTKYLYL